MFEFSYGAGHAARRESIMHHERLMIEAVDFQRLTIDTISASTTSTNLLYSSDVAINFSAMPNGKQMNLVLL